MIGILYFSGTGNSKWIADQAREILVEKGLEAEVISAEKGFAKVEELYRKSDKLIIVYPVYGSDMPKPLKEILFKLSSKEAKDTMILVTQLSFSGDINNKLAKDLKLRGFNTIGVGEYYMSNNICSSLFKKKPLIGRELEENLEKNLKQLTGDIDKFLKGEKFLKKLSIVDRVAGGGQRLSFNTFFPIYSKAFSMNERCTLCGYCKKACPVGAIEIDDKVKWTNNCVLCARCYNYCPFDGINLLKSSVDNEKYPRYRGPLGRRSAYERD